VVVKALRGFQHQGISHPPLGKVEPNIILLGYFSGAILAPPFPKVDTRE